jgi:hypothetical protein
MLLCINLFLVYKHFSRPKHPPRLSSIVGAQGEHAQELDNEMWRHRHFIKRAHYKQVKLREKLIRLSLMKAAQRKIILQQIATLQFDIDSATLSHFDRVEQLCNKKEKHLFQQFKRRIIQPKAQH